MIFFFITFFKATTLKNLSRLTYRAQNGCNAVVGSYFLDRINTSDELTSRLGPARPLSGHRSPA